jgi:hypothetical protein
MPFSEPSGRVLSMYTQPFSARSRQMVALDVVRYSISMITSGSCSAKALTISKPLLPPPCRMFQEIIFKGESLAIKLVALVTIPFNSARQVEYITFS